MPRLFLGNFDFEHRLADPQNEPSAKLKRLNAELATSWLAIADDGDWIWTPSPIEPVFFLDAVREGLPKVIPVTSLANVPNDVECVPWGWSAEIRKLAKQFGWHANAPLDKSVRLANSRATSEELERSWDISLHDARRIETLNEFTSAIRSLRHASQRWVVKAEFGMSARERILGQGPPSASDENWVRRRLAAQGAVFFEPWVERIDELGIQIDVPRDGIPQLIGLTPMLVDGRGQYAGSWFERDRLRFPFDEGGWSEAVEVALRAATQVQSLGYFGPLGIDSMKYRDEDGRIQIRPLQDINARWTMGRLSLGLRRFVEPVAQGFWQHRSKDAPLDSVPFDATRIIATSPDRVGGDDCRHASRILLRISK